MSRTGYRITSVVLILLGFILTILVYPSFFNKQIDALNSRFGWHLSHVWTVPFKLGLDLKGGVELLYEADLSKIQKKDYSQVMNGLRDIIERRISSHGAYGLGVTEAEVRIVGNNRFDIKIPGVVSSKKAIEMIGKTPYLEFKEERPKPEIEKTIKDKLKDKAKGISPDAACITPGFVNQFIKQFHVDPCYKSTGLTGRYLTGAEMNLDQKTYSSFLVNLKFNKQGAKLFEQITARNVGKPLAIYIDNVLISAPRVQEKISGGNAQITGKFTAQEAKKLAQNLNAGALSAPIHLISQRTIGPTLGMISLKKSLLAAIVGFLSVITFLIIFYRFAGLLASVALFIYMVITLSLFKFIPVTMTLAGIGGFVLSIGMAVDANILIFSRMREELQDGKDFSQATDEGFRRAWPSIRDGNLTTLIAALILFTLGTSFVKGFATTLTLGILVSMFSAIFVTRTFLKSFSRTRLEKIKWFWQ